MAYYYLFIFHACTPLLNEVHAYVNYSRLFCTRNYHELSVLGTVYISGILINFNELGLFNLTLADLLETKARIDISTVSAKVLLLSSLSFPSFFFLYSARNYFIYSNRQLEVENVKTCYVKV